MNMIQMGNNYKFRQTLAVIVLLLGMGMGHSQETVVEVDMSKIISEVQPTMYGVFFEDINFAADGGLYAEMIKNRSFEFPEPMMGWSQPNSDRHSHNRESGIASTVKYPGHGSNHNYIRIQINNDKGYSLINEGFRGMGIKKDALYNLSFMAASLKGTLQKMTVQFVDPEENSLGEAIIPLKQGADWNSYTAQLKATGTVAKARLKITFEGNGTLELDLVSLFPEDTWMGRKNGMRKDIVQLLHDLDPGFLRFPGGCIVEGRTLADRYQWKKTVGPVEDREFLINRWNTEFSHRPTPDYYQSFGIGFFEYFQLSEDLGAEPLPILSCGMACQFNTGELVPMEELDPYVQDALDLIEFANGSVDTPWGKVREEMGHPKPFNLKFIGVGNEQWGPDYIERFKVFEKAIKSKYPQITIVSGSGPFPEGDFFEYGMEELKKLNAELVDEHYYRSPQWFRENAARYDSYDRNGPKIFAGEYAAQSAAIASPENRNNWNCAVSEAAFMTGLERNAEVVHLTSYAPLMAHEEGWQWTPDLIWFNNLETYGTANYYVQKMFSTHRGSDVVPITHNNLPLTGQDGLFASAVIESASKEVFLKLVNTSVGEKAVNVQLKGKKVLNKGTLLKMQSHDLEAVNSFGEPKKISPVETEIKIKGTALPLTLPPYSFTIVKLRTK
jgi:alpha-N-arabinofuranosidase